MIASVLRRTVALAAFGLLPQSGIAGEAWDDIRDILFDERPVISANETSGIELNVPYRTSDDRRTRMGAEVALADGALIHKIYLVIDENPMPVSAVFEMARPTAEFSFDATMRLNGPGGVHLVVETEAGELYVSESFVKTSGVGACAAAPGTDPVLALKTLGQMDVTLAATGDTASAATRLAALAGTGQSAQASPAAAQRAEIAFRHPSHSGLQKDQITLLYLPARFIETVEVSTDDQPMFTMTGSISLSEDPVLSVELPPAASALSVKMTDTEGAAFKQVFSLGQS